MPLTPYPDVDRLLVLLRSRIERVLGGKLLGLYLTGSLVTGDFDLMVSDLDLVAVTAAGPSRPELDALGAMHRELAAQEPRWDDRIEVVYVPAAALRTFRTRSSRIAVTSPGEPFHTRLAGEEWLINWYVLRQKGVALHGPPSSAFVDPISDDELVRAARDSALLWRGWVTKARRRNAQVYAVLTACRALYTSSQGDFVSKRRAGLWAAAAMPEWAALIHEALRIWREDWYAERPDDEAMRSETVRFVNDVADRIEGAVVGRT